MTEPSTQPQPMPGLPPGYDGVAEARRLLRVIRSGALATMALDGGFPFASLVTVATDHDGAPLLLLSRLSAHTRNLDADPRASILLAQGGKGDALAHPRITVTGHARRQDDPVIRARLRRRFLARHPKAALYADFGDFGFWRLEMVSVHLNGGFARAADYAASQILSDIGDAQALLAAEESILAHLNDDHAETLGLYATKLAGEPPARWSATGIDPDGLDLAAGDLTARLVFPGHVTEPAALRHVLAELAGQARQA